MRSQLDRPSGVPTSQTAQTSLPSERELATQFDKVKDVRHGVLMTDRLEGEAKQSFDRLTLAGQGPKAYVFCFGSHANRFNAVIAGATRMFFKEDGTPVKSQTPSAPTAADLARQYDGVKSVRHGVLNVPPDMLPAGVRDLAQSLDKPGHKSDAYVFVHEGAHYYAVKHQGGYTFSDKDGQVVQ